jgi:hypothetical protein
MRTGFQERTEKPLQDQIHEWERDELEKRSLEQGRSGEGTMHRLDHLRSGELDQVMCERPSGSSHVEVGAAMHRN